MKLPSVCCTALLATLVLASAQARGTGDAIGASPVQRCDGGDGNAIYTDKPCAVLRAQPGRMSDDLSLRIAMASTGDYADASRELAVGAYRDAAEPLRATLPATTRRSASAGCARSPQQLSRDLVGAFALHDDGLGLSRLLLQADVTRLFPDGYRVALPDMQAGMVLATSAPPELAAAFLETVQHYYAEGGVPLRAGLHDPALLRIRERTMSESSEPATE